MATLIPLDDIPVDLPDESAYGRDPFEICALMEEESGEPLKETDATVPILKR